MPVDPILNPVTGERMWIERSALVQGGALRARFLLPPGANSGPAHRHPDAAERFEVLEGALDLTLAGVTRRLGPNEALEVPPDCPHGFRNASGQDVLMRVGMEPGAGLERFLRGWYGLAADGRVRPDGSPRSLLALATLLEWGGIVLEGVPRRPQELVRGALAWLASRAGVADHLARHLPREFQA